VSAAPIDTMRATLQLQHLMGRRVVDADGRRVGRVVECLAEADGDDLRVVGLLVGPGAWAARFGSAVGYKGRFVKWEDIAAIEPCITLQTPVD
jgi:sporulation protein YlmC with PRC-barrel domain